jgi:quinol monooxygenase YgiN
MPQSLTVSHLVFARARVGHSEQLGARLQGLIEPALNTTGCLSFALQHSLRDPDLWLIAGSWSNEQTMNAWFEAPELQVFSDIVQTLMVSSLDFHTFAACPVTGAGVSQMLQAV